MKGISPDKSETMDEGTKVAERGTGMEKILIRPEFPAKAPSRFSSRAINDVSYSERIYANEAK